VTHRHDGSVRFLVSAVRYSATARPRNELHDESLIHASEFARCKAQREAAQGHRKHVETILPSCRSVYDFLNQFRVDSIHSARRGQHQTPLVFGIVAILSGRSRGGAGLDLADGPGKAGRPETATARSEMTMAKENRGCLSPAEELARIPLYEKGKSPQPLIDVDFVDEIDLACGRRWGAQTELGTLRSVLVQAPTPGPVSAPVVREDPIFFAATQGGLPGAAHSVRVFFGGTAVGKNLR
jgi:hypothetical protein